jgi:RNA polymerase sigma factor (TIGR02999 family)
MSDASRRSAKEILPLVYGELRRLAGAYMRGERAGHTLQSTALVHEAYLRLAKHRDAWNGKTHFFALAAIEMRRVLVEHARARNADKRGGGLRAITLDEAIAAPGQPIDYLAVDEALSKLERRNPRHAAVAQYRLFAGLTEAEMAAILDVSERTVREDWRFVKAWLRREIEEGAGD